ncbi:MAG: hypothetical protein AW09_000037 [Candidatus Accumulibacter phosphatis]|uniref:Uncharacterized protein n=1 Tax=Candidatus Accumulibacter phosphatis TaxID=327160 RepID=A0A080M2T0_9PROT|nr:MAG: hypothetical protein AW09_000037 [Candidatus Accumulibacter phosphatis]
MRVDVEVGVVGPPATVGVLRGDLPETTVTHDALRDGVLETFGVDATLEDHHTEDLHEVFRAVHAQPGVVDVGNSFARVHRRCSRGKWPAHIIASHFKRSSTGEETT